GTAEKGSGGRIESESRTRPKRMTMGSRGTRSTTGTRARLRRGIARDGRLRPTSTISLSYLMPLQADRFANPMSIGVVRSNCPRLPPSDPNYLPAHPNRGVFDSQQPHHSLCLLGCHRAHPSSRRERRPIERTSTSPRSPTRGPPQPYPPKRGERLNPRFPVPAPNRLRTRTKAFSGPERGPSQLSRTRRPRGSFDSHSNLGPRGRARKNHTSLVGLRHRMRSHCDIGGCVSREPNPFHPCLLR